MAADLTRASAAAEWRPPQEPEESPEEYAAFVTWAAERPRRTIATMPAGVVMVAGARRWVERARAWDREMLVAGLTELEQARFAVKAMTKAMAISAQVRLEHVMTSAEVPSQTDILGMKSFVADAPAAPEREAVPWHVLTAEEMRAVREAAATIQRLRAKAHALAADGGPQEEPEHESKDGS